MELERIMEDIDEYVHCPKVGPRYDREYGGDIKREELKSAVKTVYEAVTSRLGRQGVDRLYHAFERLARLNVYSLRLSERVAVSYDGDVDFQLIERQDLKIYVCRKGQCRELIRERRRVQQFPYPILVIARQGSEVVSFEELKRREERDTGQYVWELKPHDLRPYVGRMVAKWLFPDEATWKAALVVARFYHCLPYHPFLEVAYRLYDLGALN